MGHFTKFLFVVIITIVQYPSIEGTSYFLDLEVTSFLNPDHRLNNGQCCGENTINSTVTSSCPDEGSCSPFYKICFTNIKPLERVISSTSLPQPRSGSRIGHYRMSSVRSEPTIKQPGILKSFLTRIASSITSYMTDPIGSTATTLSRSTCSIGYFEGQLTIPITLRVSVPKKAIAKSPSPPSSSTRTMSRSEYHTYYPAHHIYPYSSFYRYSFGSLSRMESPSPSPFSFFLPSFRTLDDAPSVNTPDNLQQVYIVIEIVHRKSPSNGSYIKSSDELIARFADGRNTTIQKVINGDLYWEETSKQGSANSIEYKWRLTEEADQEEPTTREETTTKMACPDGYTGDNCKIPICSSTCHVHRGYCDKPGGCKCRFGWTGEDCNMCVQIPGCVHGSCNKPFECKCEEGWSGMFCDKPTCKVGCHPQNGYCEHPGECRCRFGFKGDNCSSCATMPGCQQGSCDQPLDCNCHSGWKGLFCSTPLCLDGCDLNHGWCRRPNECRCRIGWTGRNCNECVPYPGCDHGSCSDPWTCNCHHGWGGITCSENLDSCESMANPCLNGGTCISVEKADGGFICQCPLPYEGDKCQQIKQ